MTTRDGFVTPNRSAATVLGMMIEPRKPRIAQRLVDDADHDEELVVDVQPWLEVDPRDAEFSGQIGTDDCHGVAALNVTVVEPAPRRDVAANRAEYPTRRRDDRHRARVGAGRIEKRHRAYLSRVRDVRRGPGSDDAVEPIEA